MNIDASQLLKLLGSATPKLSGQTPGAEASPSQAAFDELLAKAKSGELSSSRLVEVDEDAGLELTSEQVALLSVAADRAEAQGLRHALVIMDDAQVLLDVGARRVTGRAALDPTDGQPAILPGVDGVINVSSRLKSEPAPARIGPPSAGLNSPALSNLLEQLGIRVG